MSTDITMAASSATTLSFNDFAREHLPLVARAVQVLAQDNEQANAAITLGTRSILASWPQQQDAQQAQRHVFGEAAAYLLQQATADVNTAASDVITSTAVAMGHHVFGWNAASTMHLLGLTADEYFDRVEDTEMGERLRDDVAQAKPAYVDLATITETSTSSNRRSVGLVLGAIAALVVVAVTAQFVSSPERELGQVAPPSVVGVAPERELGQVAPPSVVGVAPERPSFPGENMDLDSFVVAPRRVPVPPFIASDRTEGFVGVEPSSVPGETVFWTSTDGIAWQRVGSWEFGSPVSISRFERAGTYFVVWFEAADEPRPRLAFSQDLRTWTVPEVPVDEPPLGLIYRSEFTDVATIGDLVVAVVSTEIEIDFAALLLSEGYTCGHSITRDAVSVNRCNSQLDVWTASDGEQLAPPNRLFISRNGQPFEGRPVPMRGETQPQLRVANDEFVITDSTGLGFATSPNAQGWSAGAAQQPPFPVQMSVDNGTGQVLGVGKAGSDETALFFNDGPSTTSTPLDQIVADASTAATVLLASTPTRWVAYVFEPDGRAWIAVSNDGLNWEVTDAAGPGGIDVQLVASDDIAIVRLIDADSETPAMIIALPID